MARSQIRFAGTPTSRTRYTPKSGSVRVGGSQGFDPISLGTAGTTTNAGSAAGTVNTSAIYKGLADNSPDYQDIAYTAASNNAATEMAVENSIASAAMAGIQGAAKVESAEEQAKALEAEAGAAKKGGFMSAVTGIASAAAPLLLASDETTKHTIDRLENACAILRELKPVTFFYKEEYSSSPERMHYGFIAQEYQKVMPDATYYDESIGKLCIDPTELIGLLVRANQELQARVSRMEAKQALQAV